MGDHDHEEKDGEDGLEGQDAGEDDHSPEDEEGNPNQGHALQLHLQKQRVLDVPQENHRDHNQEGGKASLFLIMI